MNQLMHVVWDALEMRDGEALSAALMSVNRQELYFNPHDPDIPDRARAGSVAGLIAFSRWHEGMEVLIEAKINLNINNLVRNPLLWAWNNDDPKMVSLLMQGGYDPLWYFIDTRVGQPHRHWERFGPLWSSKMRASECYGKLDDVCVKSFLTSTQQHPVLIRPILATCLLSKSRPNSYLILQSLLNIESLKKSDDVKYYARYLLGRLRFKPDILLEKVIREQLGVTDALDLPEDLNQTGTFNALQ